MGAPQREGLNRDHTPELASVSHELRGRLGRQLRDALTHRAQSERLYQASRLLGDQAACALLEAEMERLAGEELRLLRAFWTLCPAPEETDLEARVQELAVALLTLTCPTADPAAIQAFPGPVPEKAHASPFVAGEPGRADPGLSSEARPTAPRVPLFRAPGVPAPGAAAPAAPAESSRAAIPAWEPRTTEQLQAIREQIHSNLADLTPEDPRHLAWFKAEAARFRAAWEERKRLAGSQSDWWLLRNEFRQRQRDDWAGEYCIPLADIAHLSPAQWLRLADLYHDLGLAAHSVRWVQQQLETSDSGLQGSPRDAFPLLEVCAAAVNRIHRWIVHNLSGYHDNEEERVYRQLRDWAHQFSIFLRLLQGEERVKDAELEIEVTRLEERHLALEEVLERRRRGEVALGRLEGLVTQPGFGTAFPDPDRLCEALGECLDCGLPPTERRVRELVLPWHWMLEGDPRVERVQQALQEDVERLGREAALERASHQLDPAAAPQNAAALAAILPQTRGRRALILGGICWELNRRAIVETFEFASAEWPEVADQASLAPVSKRIGGVDYLFLTYLSRTRVSEAWKICAEQNTTLIILPGGYALQQVLVNLFERLHRPQPG